jgi:hypothetical protein
MASTSLANTEVSIKQSLADSLRSLGPGLNHFLRESSKDSTGKSYCLCHFYEPQGTRR